jgi:hypothetical protein
MHVRTKLIAGLITSTALLVPASAQAAEPTCSSTLGIAVHGQHIVGDYVTGLHGDLEWTPSGGVVGDAVAGSGDDLPLTPGGPGPGFHFPNGFAPGASFCLDESQSPGTHLGP